MSEGMQKGPDVLTLEAGRYFWCMCGLSGKQPFCDGAHKGSGFKSLPFMVEEAKAVILCRCKKTKTPPFCDGTHQNL